MTIEQKIFNITCQTNFWKSNGARDVQSGKKIEVDRIESHTFPLHVDEVREISPLYHEDIEAAQGKRSRKGWERLPPDTKAVITFVRQGQEFQVYITEDVIPFSRDAKKYPDVAEKLADTEIQKLIVAVVKREKELGIFIIQDAEEMLAHAAKATVEMTKKIARGTVQASKAAVTVGKATVTMVQRGMDAWAKRRAESTLQS